MAQPQKSVVGSDLDFLFDGFFENHPMARSMEILSRLGKNEAISYQWTFSPMAASYFNPLGGLFLIQIFDLQLLSIEKAWLIRDGRVPLLWFFRKHPVPSGVQSTLLVDEDLYDCVPEAWRPHFATYRLVTAERATPPTHSILMGLAAEAYCSLPSLRNHLAVLKRDKNFVNSQRIDLFLPVREWAAEDTDESYHTDYFHTIFANMPSACRSLNHRAVVSAGDLQDAMVKDLNDKMLLADNSVMHQLLKKGARLYGSRPLKSHERYVALSPHHGYAVSEGTDMVEKPVVAAGDEDFIQTRYDALNSRAFRQFPWPKWFEEFARHAQDVVESAASEEEPEQEPDEAPVVRKKKKLKKSPAKGRRTRR